MAKQQFRGMEELTRQTQALAAFSPSVDGIPTDGITDGGEMSSDLVRPTCDEPDPQKGGARQLLLDLEVGDRVAWLVGPGGHHGARSAVAPDRGVDRAAAGVGPAVD